MKRVYAVLLSFLMIIGSAVPVFAESVSRNDVEIEEEAGEVPYVIFNQSDHSLTFKYGLKPGGDNVWGINDTKYLNDWSRRFGRTTNPDDYIYRVVFDQSFSKARPKSCFRWFSGFYLLQDIQGIQYLNTSEVRYMDSMFCELHFIKSIDVSGFDTSNVISFDNMFSNCRELTNIDISNFSYNSTKTIFGMFQGCWSLKSINMHNLTTTNNI